MAFWPFRKRVAAATAPVIERAPRHTPSRVFDEAFLHRLESLYLVSRKIAAGREHAERRSKKIGSGLEFADHRDYTPGDDIRHLDWQVYARTEKMLLRRYEEEEDLVVYFLLDASRSMGMGLGEVTKLDLAIRLAAALGYVALANLDRMCVVPFGDKILERMPPTRGKNQIFKVFRFLEGIEAGGPTSLEEAARKFVHQNKRRGMVVVLSDFYDPKGYETALNVLRYHGYEVLAVHLFDEAELTPEALRGDLSVIDCETGEMKEVTITPRLLAKYREVHARFSDTLRDFCKKSQIGYFKTPIQVPYDDVVLRIFRSGGFLQ